MLEQGVKPPFWFLSLPLFLIFFKYWQPTTEGGENASITGSQEARKVTDKVFNLFYLFTTSGNMITSPKLLEQKHVHG